MVVAIVVIGGLCAIAIIGILIAVKSHSSRPVPQMGAMRSTVRRPTIKASRQFTSIYVMSDEELAQKFGDDWEFARECIERKRELIASGLEKDWDSIRQCWDRMEPVTDSQDAILISKGVMNCTTKYEASFIIDEIFLRDDVEMLKREKQHNAEVLFKKREKEEIALKFLAAEMADPDYKPRRLRSKKSKDVLEFRILVNKIIEDNEITADEVVSVRDWLLAHKVLDDDFQSMLTTIDAALEDGVVDEIETTKLYEGMLDCIITLRHRP